MSDLSTYQHMQSAVDIVSTSTHPTNKIAATLAGTDALGKPYALSRVNHWPKPIESTIGRNADIGNSSGTVHAETACILAAPKTENADIFVTDPPCPNCMKNMAEAGIKALYIDHKGFDKDWAKRRGDSFDVMSMRIAAKAGMDVFVIFRKEQRLDVIARHAHDYKPSIENPPHITPADSAFETLIEKTKAHYNDDPFALALAKNAAGKTLSILVNRHPTIGYTSRTIEPKDDKYSFMLQPVNRLLMIAAKEGLTLDPQAVYSSRTPTSREFVNLIGAGITTLKIGDQNTARDEMGLHALQQLKAAKILNIS